MTKKNLSKIAEILPFNDKYVLVGKKKYANSKTLVWNLMDKDGRLLSDNWFASISKNSDGSIKTEVKTTARAKKVTEVHIVDADVLDFGRNALDHGFAINHTKITLFSGRKKGCTGIQEGYSL